MEVAFDGDFGPTPIDLRPPPVKPKTFTLTVELLDMPMPVWRSLEVPGETTLDRLHLILQVAMGWEDDHLHRFTLPVVKRGGGSFATDGDEGGTHEADARLDQVLAKAGSKLHYTYDFGDGWEHLITVAATRRMAGLEVRCLDGQGACPPEDCGGPWAYQGILAALNTREGERTEDEEELIAGLPEGFDPTGFDTQATDRLLAGLPERSRPSDAQVPTAVLPLLAMTDHPSADLLALLGAADLKSPAPEPDAEVAASMVRAWIVLLQQIGSGVKLTQDGDLPPATVRSVFAQLDLESDLLDADGRESETLPVAALRASAVSLGLARAHRGMLAATALGRGLAGDPDALITDGDPAGMLRHIEDRMPLEASEFGGQAAVLLLLATAAGAPPDVALAPVADVLNSLGWRTDDDLPVEPDAVAAEADRTHGTLLLMLSGLAGDDDADLDLSTLRGVARRALRGAGMAPMPDGIPDVTSLLDVDEEELIATVAAPLIEAVGDARHPLEAELALCAGLAGAFLAAPPDAQGQEADDTLALMVMEVIGYAEQAGGEDALALLRAAVVIGPEATRAAANAAAERLAASGVPDQRWAAHIGRPAPKSVWRYGDLRGEQESLGIVFDYNHREHVVMVLIDHQLGGGVKDCWVATGKRAKTIRREVSRDVQMHDDQAFFEDLQISECLHILDETLAREPCPVDPDQVEDVAEFLPLLRARARHLHDQRADA